MRNSNSYNPPCEREWVVRLSNTADKSACLERRKSSGLLAFLLDCSPEKRLAEQFCFFSIYIHLTLSVSFLLPSIERISCREFINKRKNREKEISRCRWFWNGALFDSGLLIEVSHYLHWFKSNLSPYVWNLYSSDQFNGRRSTVGGRCLPAFLFLLATLSAWRWRTFCLTWLNVGQISVYDNGLFSFIISR